MVARGRVQGVGYRYSMRDLADAIGAAGWVRNRRDGTVEAEVEGTPEQVGQMLAWAAEGPPMASVVAVDVTDLEPTGEQGFEPRPTL